MDHPATAYPDADLNAQPPGPDTWTRADFACIEDFIASGAFDEAVLRAAKRGVERAVARDRELGLGGAAARE